MHSASKPIELNIITALNILQTLAYDLAHMESKDESQLPKEIDSAIDKLKPFPDIQQLLLSIKPKSEKPTNKSLTSIAKKLHIHNPKKTFLAKLSDEISRLRKENAQFIINTLKYDAKRKVFINFYYDSITMLGDLIQEIQKGSRFEYPEQSLIRKIIAQERNLEFKKTIIKTVISLDKKLENIVEDPNLS